MKKKILIFVFTLFLALIIFPQKSTVQAKSNLIICQTTDNPAMRADIIDWRYKAENNKLYKRQYNYSKGEWIGEWILC